MGEFQDKMKKKHKKMKFKLIGKGGNKHKAAPFKENPNYERSESAPAGFGALEEKKED
tara:strand:+ start:2563 stop:2736 length:174 start_codon:yes stop_codon:yes gene_type:complete